MGTTGVTNVLCTNLYNRIPFYLARYGASPCDPCLPGILYKLAAYVCWSPFLASSLIYPHPRSGLESVCNVAMQQAVCAWRLTDLCAQ